MISEIPNTLKITSRKEYIELRDVFDVIFMNMKIAEPAVYLDKIYDVIKKSEFLDEFKERCKEYFPKYPKRMSAWYTHAVINPLEDEKQRVKETFDVITQFVAEDITAQLALHTFPHISREELTNSLLVLDKKEGRPTISMKYTEAFFQYAKKFDSSSELFEAIKDYSRDKQFYMIEDLVVKGWFSPKKYKYLTTTNSVSKEDFYNLVIEKEKSIECLKSLTPVLLELLKEKKFKEQSLKRAFSGSTEKNKYFIENLVITQEDANKAIDYSMDYECQKDINSTVGFVNYNLINHFTGVKQLEATEVCLMISRCFIYRLANPQYCELIIGLMDIIKEGDKSLYQEVNEKINSDEKFYIYEMDGRDRTVTFGTPEFKGFLSELLFEKLNNQLDSKPVEKKIKL